MGRFAEELANSKLDGRREQISTFARIDYSTSGAVTGDVYVFWLREKIQRIPKKTWKDSK